MRRQKVPQVLDCLRDQIQEFQVAQPCIYFLINKKELVYIGQSIKPGSRIASHMTSKQFDRSFILPVKQEDLLAVERAFIRLFRPPLNEVHVNGLTMLDREIINRYGVAIEQVLMIQGPVCPEEWGAVQVVDGEYEGMVGYFDNDHWEHYCLDYCDEKKIDLEDLSEEENLQICQEHRCEYLAVVYLSEWSDGPKLMPHSYLRYLPDNSREAKQIVLDLFPKMKCVECLERVGIMLPLDALKERRRQFYAKPGRRETKPAEMID